MKHKLSTVLTALSFIAVQSAPAQNLKFISNPGGGQAIYGPIKGSGDSRDAMISMLKLVHGHFGTKPNLGRIVSDRSGSTVAVFFTVTGQKVEKGPISGLLIVSAPSANHRTAALLFDSADRFPRTLRPMVKSLSQEWPPKVAAAGPAKVQPLELAHFPDGSGSVKLPQGWRLPYAGGGAFIAAGPNREQIVMNDSANNIDPTTPYGRQQIRFYTSGGRNLPSHYFAASFRQDPARNFVSIMSQRAYKVRAPAPTIKILSEKTMQDNSVQLVGESNANDGTGPMVLVANLRILAPSANGSFVMFMNHFTVPVELAERELPTMQAVCHSFSVDEKVVFAMDQAIIQQIHALSAATRGQSSGTTSATSSSAGGDEEVDPDGEARGFTNYIRDQSVIENTQNGRQATAGYGIADQLVKDHPDQLRIVPPSQYKLNQF